MIFKVSASCLKKMQTNQLLDENLSQKLHEVLEVLKQTALLAANFKHMA